MPLYRQVQDVLLDRIASGELTPGDRLPAESALASELSVNRMTVRQAISDLARDGTLRVRHGSGTFVAEPRLLLEVEVATDSPDAATERVASALQASGNVFTEALLWSEIADDAVARADLAVPRARLRRLETLASVNAEPWIVNSYWFADRSFPRITEQWDPAGGLFGVLATHFGRRTRYAWRSFAAAAASHADSELLDVPAGSPILVREGLNVDAAGLPILRVTRRCRADRAKFVLRYQPERR